MKKYLSIILAFSLLITPTPSRSGDMEGFAVLLVGGFVLASAATIAATVAAIQGAKRIMYRKKAAKLDMNLKTYLAAKWFGIDPEKYQKILRSAEQHNVDELRKEFVPIERETWGQNWATERNKLYSEYRTMLNRYGETGRDVFADQHPSVSLKSIRHLFSLYAAVAAIYYDYKLSSFGERPPGYILWKDVEKIDALLFENPLKYVPQKKQ